MHMYRKIETDGELLVNIMNAYVLKDKWVAVDFGLRTTIRLSLKKGARLLCGESSWQNDLMWSSTSKALFERLSESPDARPSVTYDHRRLDNYRPNHSYLLPLELSQELLEVGLISVRSQGIDPDSLYRLFMMDFILGAARLEGNRYSRFGAYELFTSGVQPNTSDTRMIVNHRVAFDTLVWGDYGLELSREAIQRIQGEHIFGLLKYDEPGTYRRQQVKIPESTYIPLSDPEQLSEIMDLVIRKAVAIEHPIEAAFFLWLHLAYLQAFERGNQRTGRTALNIPLLRADLHPLTFVHVDTVTYAKAMLGYYEFGDISIATDLFAWAYRQSAERYAGFNLDAIRGN